MMTPFQLVAVFCALAGLLMVGAGILFVYKGIIKIEGADQSQALSLEWKKQFKMSTQVPGVAFFLTGLLFITVSLIFLNPRDQAALTIRGEVEGLEEPLTAYVILPTKWELTAYSNGEFKGTITPNMSSLLVALNAPGYQPLHLPANLELYEGAINLGKVRLKRTPHIKDSLNQKIAQVDFNPPPVTAGSASYGGPIQ